MKKIVAILLLYPLLMYTGGYFLIYLCTKAEVHAQMKEQLQLPAGKSNTTLFTFHETPAGDIYEQSFLWEDKGGEFRYNGKMYDVVSINRQNNQVNIICISDEAENNLEANFSMLFHMRKGAKQSAQIYLLKLLSSFFIGFLILSRLGFTKMALSVFEYYLCYIARGIISILTPPPKKFLFIQFH